MSLRAWRKEEEWPNVDRENLLRTADEWLAPYLTNVTKRQDFYRLELDNILTGILPWNLGNKLDQLAPARLSVPSGSMIKLKYSSNGRATGNGSEASGSLWVAGNTHRK